MRSADRTTVAASGRNDAVVPATAWRPVSDEPSTSTMRRPGSRATSACLTGADSTAPPESRNRREDRSWSWRSSSSSSGRANGSPTICRALTRSRATRGQHVGGVEAGGIVLDDHRAARRPRRQGVPVGGAVHERRRGQRAQPGTGTGGVDDLALGGRDAECRGQEVALAPQRALGHPGRPAGVEDVAVVGRQARRAPPGWRRRSPPRSARRPAAGLRRWRRRPAATGGRRVGRAAPRRAWPRTPRGTRRRGPGCRRGRTAARSPRSGS